ncbi:MAG TPA: hypothetical protein VG274_06580 [Rhizomicrobium sp.]|nr:hypothetical protein [Rhizomicrobium sp.]
MKKDLAELLALDPFLPFVLVMNSGDRYEVRNPDLAMLAESLLYIMKPRSDRRDILRLTEISSLEILGSE